MRNVRLSPQTPPPADLPQLASRRRRLPSPEEQKRRVAWGEKWGKLVSEATADLRKG